MSKRLATIPAILVGITAVIVIIATVASLKSCFRRNYPGRTESITIGTMLNAQETLLIIAEEEGFFTANGLNVAITKYETGFAATAAMVKREVDLARATEFVVVQKALKKEEISIVTTYCRSETVCLVGRKDREIENPSDLKGKRIGVVRGTIPEFYLGRFLNLHGMSIEDVTLVDTMRTQLVDAFSAGDVDALIDGQVIVHALRQRHGGSLVIWPAQSSQQQYDILVGMNDWIARHPELVERALSSLAQAEAYVIRHPAETKAIVQKRLQYDDVFMTNSWPKHQFSLSLDQSLILAMEDEARWMIDNNLTSEKQVPDFLGCIYTRGLEAVKPGVVNIIGRRDEP